MSKRPKPSFKRAWAAFMEVNMPVKAVGYKIGGYVQKNTEMFKGGFENACPIRMSYVFNKTGFPIPKSFRYMMVSGADHMQYIYRVNDMLRYLEDTLGKPDKIVKSPKPSDFSGLQGILLVKGNGWGNAHGHVTLWDGTRCSDACHLMNDPLNGRFVPEVASIWILH